MRRASNSCSDACEKGMIEWSFYKCTYLCIYIAYHISFIHIHNSQPAALRAKWS